MPVVDDQTRRMARMLGQDEAEIQEDAEEEGLSGSFYDDTGRPSLFVGLQSDEDRENQTKKYVRRAGRGGREREEEAGQESNTPPRRGR